MDQVRDSSRSLQLLSELLFNPALTRLSEGVLDEGVFHEDRGPVAIGARASVRLQEMLESLEHQDLEQLRDLAMTNHVIMRAFRPLAQLLEDAGKELDADWVRVALEQESFRINHALGFLRDICAALEEKGCPAVVIKSLDHWPDLGSDLDLFTDADAADVVNVFRSEFKAELDNRSWGDRLANKWNFIVPGLPELVEVHVGRLGQTGEQIALTRSLCARTRTTNIAGHVFRVPAPEDRL